MTWKFNKAKGYAEDSKWEAHLIGTCKKECRYCKQKKRQGTHGMLSHLEFQPEKIPYTKPATEHNYTPDFKVEGFSKIIYIEAKGRFREAAEWKKYIHIREGLSPYEELVFLFMDPEKPLPGAKPRRDGSKRSHAEWAEKEGFKWFDEKSIIKFLEVIE